MSSRPSSPQRAPRVLYVLTSFAYFMSHRLPMADAAKAAGFEVHVAAHHEGELPEAFTERGFVFHPLPRFRGRSNPGLVFQAFRGMMRAVRATRPAVVHAVAMQPSLMMLVLKLLNPFFSPRILAAYTGMGTLFSAASLSFRHRVIRAVALMLLRIAHRSPAVFALVQNRDDAAFLRALGVTDARLFVIPGSGVDTDALVPQPVPEMGGERGVVFGFVGRMLIDKGVGELLQAFEQVRAVYTNAELRLAGLPDDQNAKTISFDEMDAIASRAGVTWFQHVDDIQGFWARCHVAVLPSRREGMPKSLLEAAACGRAMIATDVPGCRDLVRDGVNGALVPLDDVDALAHAMMRYCETTALIETQGAAARERLADGFSVPAVQAEIQRVYHALV